MLNFIEQNYNSVITPQKINITEKFDGFGIRFGLDQDKKFFIESTRLRKWQTSGILWWNLLDGWPQFSDAVVDYYFGKKLAYHYIRRAQRPVCVFISEPALTPSPSPIGRGTIGIFRTERTESTKLKNRDQ